ncbi:MAG: PQQ-binding-like beta-propeller repeat protein [Phycisphaerales bacterium]
MTRPRPIALAAALLLAATAAAQDERVSPVFFDDSTEARATIESLDQLVRAGNEAEAVRALQRLLDDEPERLVSGDGEDFQTVRSRVHEILLDGPTLLERYRDIAEPGASELLSAGDHAAAERSRLLTPSGFEAALRVTQEHLESARFGTARRTLAQLEAHPDRRRATLGRDAASLAALIASFTGDPADRALAERWAAEAGAEPPAINAFTLPERDERGASSVAGAGPSGAGAASVVPRPLRSAMLTEPSASLLDDDNQRRYNAAYQSIAWTLPAAAGDVLFTNDGLTVSAFDRYTLHPLWRVRTAIDPSQQGRYAASARRRLGRILEDASSVTVTGQTVLAATGIATPARRDGDARLHAIDRDTGAVRWSVDVSALHEDLQRSTIRGPVLVEGRTVIVTARKSVPNRRLMSVYLVGLDLETGTRAWRRLVATAGSLPFQQYNRVPQACALADGVVYRVDEMGVAIAVDAHTGRTQWLRRLAGGDLLSNARIPPWNTSAPVIVGDQLVCIAADGRTLMTLDRFTGAITGERDLADLRRPNYLMRVGDSIACIADGVVSFIPAADPIAGPITSTRAIAEPGIRGRVAIAGDQIVIPIDEDGRSGALIVDPRAPRSPEFVELDHTGNLLVMPGQIIAVDDTSAHSFLAWEAASRTLEARIAERPSDAMPAITLAELAWHAGRDARVAAAAESAIAALDAAPDETARVRLLNVVRSILIVALDPVDLDGHVITDSGVLDALVGRLDRLARTPEERVSFLMLSGRFAESRERPGDAIGAYQRVLEDPMLAGASWRGAQLEVRAELEATRRIARLIGMHGAGVYEPFSQAAAAAARTGGLAPERIARSYPYAAITPKLWLDAGDALIAEDRPFAAIRAWRAGLAAATTIADAEGAPDLGATSELVGRLVAALAGQGRDSEIVTAIATARDAFGPEFAPTDAGRPVDVEALLSAPERLRTDRRARALVGTHPRIDPDPALFAGTVLEPVRRRGADAWRRALLISGARRELTSIRPDDADVAAARWTRELAEGVVPLVLEDADDRVLLVWPGSAEGGPRVEALDQSSGDTLWNTRPLSATLPHTVPPGPQDRMVIPGGADVPLAEVVVASDERTACLVERTGRVAAFDLRDGATAWADQLEVARVADAVVTQGVLVVGGQDRAPAPPGAEPGDPPASIVVAHDAATGERLQRLEGIGGRVRWIRATCSGDVIVGADRAVTSVNLVEGRVNWTSGEIDLAGTLDAWIFGDRVILLTMERRLISLDTTNGRPDHNQLDVRQRINGLSPARSHDLGGPIALASARGIVVVGPDGELLGVDALGPDTELVPAAAGQGVLVTVEHKPLRRAGQPSGELHILSVESARLLSSAPIRVPEGVDPQPRTIALMDGRILLGYTGVTMVVEAPPTDEGG